MVVGRVRKEVLENKAKHNYENKCFISIHTQATMTEEDILACFKQYTTQVDKLTVTNGFRKSRVNQVKGMP